MQKRQVYLLSPRELSPETIAVAFAKTSRSPESFRSIAKELNDESSAKFHERWVVGYGHASVAEHAILHIAFENISRLAVECVESNRLASYTEKSTRYQKWETGAYHIPDELEQQANRDIFTRTCDHLFHTYAQSIPSVRTVVEKQNPRKEGESESAYDKRIHSRVIDSSRFLLPSAALANLGMTTNARSLEHAISKMLSHPLKEVRDIGEEVKSAALHEVPTLVKYAAPLPGLAELNDHLSISTLRGKIDCQGVKGSKNQSWCQLVHYDPDGEAKVLAAILFHQGNITYAQALKYVNQLPRNEMDSLAGYILGSLGPHDAPVRELEHTAYTFDLVLDQGAYAEFKRHRMMSQTPQNLSTCYGYEIPQMIVEAGFEKPYRHAMDLAGETFEYLAAWNPMIASYVVPNGFNRRVLFTMNLREAFAFCQLRSAMNAHFSIRRVAQRVAEEIRQVHPLLSQYMRLPDEPWKEIQDRDFSRKE